MIKSLLLVLALIFTVIGICEALYFFRMIFFNPGTYFNKYTIVFLKKNYSIKQLEFLWQKIKWHGSEFATAIIAITDNIDSDEIDCCNRFIIGKNIELCDMKSLEQCSFLKQGEH